MSPAPSSPRSLGTLSLAAALVAAAAPVLVCAALGIVGWYLSDGGVHGTPTAGMRTGVLAWLAAHGSGITVQGVAVTMLPLGITLLCAWTVWRVAMRLGRNLAGHGPDADRIADGERDLTVPAAVLVFALGYGGALLVLARGVDGVTDLSTARLLVATLVGALFLVTPAVAIGSGRAAIWVGRWPIQVAVTLAAGRRVLWWLMNTSLALVVVSLLLHWGTVANTLSELHSSTGEAVLLIGLSLLLLPNAAVFATAWLVGAGFTVGTGTFVSQSVVVLGPLPIFPLVGALPSQTPGSWATWMVAVPAVVAALAVARTQVLYPCVDWVSGGVRGAAAGVLAALGVAALTVLASGAVGPGRMADVGADASQVFVHAVAACGLGGLLAGLVMTGVQRRTLLEPAA